MSLTQSTVYLEQPPIRFQSEMEESQTDQLVDQQLEQPQEPKAEFAEQRKHVRYPFTATVEAIEQKTETRIKGRTSDLSLGGCYVDTISPFPEGTIIHLRITKGKVAFKIKARVAYAMNSMGMGLAFIPETEDSLIPAEKWIAEINGEAPVEFEEDGEMEFTDETEISGDDKYLVLSELVIELMRKGVLAEGQGKAMLRKLHS